MTKTEYNAEWRKSNPDKVKGYKKKHNAKVISEIGLGAFMDKRLEESKRRRRKGTAVKQLGKAMGRAEMFTHNKHNEIIRMHERGRDAATIVITLRVPASVVMETIRKHAESKIVPVR